ncbi:MAG: hypothetical protein ACI88A_002216 [Paraglaciecola sp.]
MTSKEAVYMSKNSRMFVSKWKTDILSVTVVSRLILGALSWYKLHYSMDVILAQRKEGEIKKIFRFLDG